MSKSLRKRNKKWTGWKPTTEEQLLLFKKGSHDKRETRKKISRLHRRILRARLREYNTERMHRSQKKWWEHQRMWGYVKKQPQGVRQKSRGEYSGDRPGKPELNTWWDATWSQGKKKAKRAPLTELYVDGHFTEDRAEWQKEFQRHCDVWPSHVIFSCSSHLIIDVHSHCMAQVSVCARHSIFMSSMMTVWSSVLCCFLVLSFSVFLSVVYLFSSTLYLHSDLHSFFHVNSAKGNTCCAFAWWGVLPPYDIPSSHKFWAHVLNDSHYSETAEMIFKEESGDKDTEPSYSCDAELDDEIIGKALSSPLFTQEREEPANRRQAYHSHEESLLPAQSFFTRTSTGRPVHEPSLCKKKKSSREMENERMRILLERQKRGNSRWRQNRDWETRISSRFW